MRSKEARTVRARTANELDYSTYGWGTIVQAAGSNLAQTYTKLIDKTDAVQRFQAFMQARFPAGAPSNLTLDNPYPIQGLHVLYVKQDGSVALTTRHLDGSWSFYSHELRNERNAKPSHFIVFSLRLLRKKSVTTSKQIQRS